MILISLAAGTSMARGSAVNYSVLPYVGSEVLSASPATPIPEPFFYGKSHRQYFGDDRTIRLLGQLALKDPNPLVRQRAVLDLSKTNNSNAIKIIKKVLDDQDYHVRCAAALALCQFPPEKTLGLLKDALEKACNNTSTYPKQADLTGLIRAVRYMKQPVLAEPLMKLLKHPDPTIRTDVLNTLSEMKKSPPLQVLEKLINDNFASVRLAAVKNAAFAKADAKLITLLEKIVGNDRELPAIRGEALSSLAKLGPPERLDKTILSLSKNPNPLIRIGAVRVLAVRGYRKRIQQLLYDPSTPVQLEAVKAAGKLKIVESIDRLFQILTDTPPKQLHQAARVALEEISTQDVAKKAGELFIKLKGQYLKLIKEPWEKMTFREWSIFKRKRLKLARNLASLSYILTSLKSYEAYDERIDLLNKVGVLDPVLKDIAASLGQFGDKRASKSIKKRLVDCADYTLWALRETFRDPTHPKPVPEDNSSALIVAAVKLQIYDALPVIMRFSSMGFERYRAKRSGWTADMMMPALVDEKTRPIVIDELRKQLRRRFAPIRCKFESAKSLGKLKAAEALDDLHWLLEERYDKRLMIAAAWAIQQITGKTPPIGQPRPYPGDWIIKSIEEVPYYVPPPPKEQEKPNSSSKM